MCLGVEKGLWEKVEFPGGKLGAEVFAVTLIGSLFIGRMN